MKVFLAVPADSKASYHVRVWLMLIFNSLEVKASLQQQLELQRVICETSTGDAKLASVQYVWCSVFEK